MTYAIVIILSSFGGLLTYLAAIEQVVRDLLGMLMVVVLIGELLFLASCIDPPVHRSRHPRPCPDPGFIEEYRHVSHLLQFPDLTGSKD